MILFPSSVNALQGFKGLIGVLDFSKDISTMIFSIIITWQILFLTTDNIFALYAPSTTSPKPAHAFPYKSTCEMSNSDNMESRTILPCVLISSECYSTGQPALGLTPREGKEQSLATWVRSFLHLAQS